MHLLLTLFLFAAIGGHTATQQPAERISGDWILTEWFPDEIHTHRMNLAVTGDKVTGTSAGSKLDGSISGAEFTLKWFAPNGQPIDATYRGRPQGARLQGEGEWMGLKVKWSARRPLAQPQATRTLTFEPTEFHRVFTHALPPVMKIFPGDTVKTWSVDAGGVDPKSVRRSQGGNPLTGPFFIEGAIPGDTLVVKLNRVRTNRDWAQSGQSVVGNALGPGYLMTLNRAKQFSSRWKLDSAKGIAFLETPSEPLKALTIPLAPMMGRVGVAPPGRDVVATRDSGVFGGNMDYNQLREGTTVYLPVFHEGALLFMGDGHAAQGDGELTGDALETSMDFEFTVDVVKERSIGGPRAENAEYIMSIGIGGSLDQALQRATTDMARWLEGEYKLNSTESAIILGFAMRYDVADLVGTQVSIVAKIPKATLAPLKKP